MQSSQDDNALLWLNQIQRGIQTANQDEEDALECMSPQFVWLYFLFRNDKNLKSVWMGVSDL